MIFGVDLGVRSLYIVDATEMYKFVIDKRDRYDELHALARIVNTIFHEDDVVFYEAPPLAGSRNLQTLIALSQVSGALLAASQAKCYEVPVSTWKKEIVGKGNASKDEIAQWLAVNDPEAHTLCAGDQNMIDATCLRKYGERTLDKISSAT